MLAGNQTILCDGCGVEILLSPVKAGNHTFCCKDCADGLKCSCGTNMDLEQWRRARSYEENSGKIEP